MSYFVFDRASLIDLNDVDYLQMFDYYFGQVKDVLEIEIGVYRGVLVVVVAMSAVFGDFYRADPVQVVHSFSLVILVVRSDAILSRVILVFGAWVISIGGDESFSSVVGISPAFYVGVFDPVISLVIIFAVICDHDNHSFLSVMISVDFLHHYF